MVSMDHKYLSAMQGEKAISDHAMLMVSINQEGVKKKKKSRRTGK